jgi:heme iron utilization protein
MVAYVPEPDFGAFLLHLSRLARHTRNLLADPRASLAISATDPGDGDAQQLPRVSIQGRVLVVDSASPGYGLARKRYLERLPEARERFSFSDFLLLRLIATEARFVGGFSRAYTLRAEQLREVAAG